MMQSNGATTAENAGAHPMPRAHNDMHPCDEGTEATGTHPVQRCLSETDAIHPHAERIDGGRMRRLASTLQVRIR